MKKVLLIGLIPLFLQGCGAIPGSGPSRSSMNDNGRVSVRISSVPGEEQDFKFALADINPNLLKFISRPENLPVNSFNWPENTPAQNITVNVGDTIQISIFESQSGGLFIPNDSGTRPGNFVSLPSQTINSTGFITVPYAGKIKAAGKTTEEISEMIVAKLKNKAIEPQVVVSFGDRAGAEVSVIGAVNDAKRLSLGFNEYSVLDAIASAGGPSSPGYETKVSLQRNKKEFNIPFDYLVTDPIKNIYSEVNDIIYLYREPKTFTAYGAVQTQGNIPFGKSNLVLSEALGLTRGLVDTQADPAEIYVYRQRKYSYYKPNTKPVSKSNVKSWTKVNGDNITMETKASEVVGNQEDEGMIPVIFKLDMRKPSGLFLAQKFAMEDQDVVYVANAGSVEFLKFINIINPTATTKINTKAAF